MVAYGRTRIPGKIDPGVLGLADGPPPPVGWHAAFWAGDLALTNGGLVATWADRSGNARDLAQATSGNRPLYRSNVSALGGRPAVEFDGVNDYLRTATWTGLAQPITYVVIMRTGATVGTPTASFFIADKATNTNAMSFYWSVTSGPVVYWSTYAGSAEGRAGSGVGPGANTNYALRALLNGASSGMNVNGSGVALTGSIGTGTSDGLTLGASRSAAGVIPNSHIAFAGVYAGDVTADGGWAAFCAWVGAHYGLTLA